MKVIYVFNMKNIIVNKIENENILLFLLWFLLLILCYREIVNINLLFWIWYKFNMLYIVSL